MIISDKYRFVFIHIPKCAGTAVRKPLQSFDSCKRRFTGRVDDHAVLGRLDYVHIPLFALSEHFPTEFKAVRDYWSFAVMRDPFARFASSVSQRLNMYSDQPIHKRSLEEVRSVVDECIEHLSRQPRNQNLLSPEYIHFQKQVDFIRVDGLRIIDTLYTVDAIGDLIGDVSRCVGQSLATPVAEDGAAHANRTMVFRNDFARRVIETTRPVADRLRTVLPVGTKEMIRDWVYVARDQRMENVFAAEHVRSFISDYYAEDITLYQQVYHHERSEPA